jgi:hypothetical protein
MSKTLKAGWYYIGDPCYLFEESWDQILEETDYFNNKDSKMLGHDFFCSNTAHGDGEFHDQFNNRYPVDAGCISCLPIELMDVDKRVTKEQVKGFGSIIFFENDFECLQDEGIFQIGHIRIDTYGYDEDEDEEAWEEED